MTKLPSVGEIYNPQYAFNVAGGLFVCGTGTVDGTGAGRFVYNDARSRCLEQLEMLGPLLIDFFGFSLQFLLVLFALLRA